MPPQSPIPNENEDRLLPPANFEKRKKSSGGSLVGIVIILIILVFGALYFWDAKLNARAQTQVPLILPGTDSTSSTTTSQ